MTRETDTAVLLYDEGCRLCGFFASLVRYTGFQRGLSVVPLQQGENLLPGLSEAERLSSAHIVSMDGRVYSGAAALRELLRILPVIGGPFGRLENLPLARSATDALYDLLVTLRIKLTCALPPKEGELIVLEGSSAGQDFS